MSYCSSCTRNFFIAVVAVLFSSSSNSQVPVYADAVKGDSISIAINDLFKELGKAGLGNYQLFPLSAYKGNGFIFVQPANFSRNIVPIPGKLRGYGPEGMYVKADNKSVVLIGNSALALQEAVFIYLEQLGFRYLMPGSIWEEIPTLTTPYKPTDILTKPDFDYRLISMGHGYYNKKKIENDYNTWAKANRLGGSFEVRAGHSYEAIVQRNEKVFKEHPEYFAQEVKRGELPVSPKFDVTNKDLIQLVVKDAGKRLDEFKQLGYTTTMVSMESSDGPGYCKKASCKAIGGASEQQYYLSNIVARELRKTRPGVWVGTLAYSDHILPPSIKIEPNTFVMVTHGFNWSGKSTEQLLGLWKQKVPAVGVYDYLSVYEWDKDLPGQVTVAKTKANQERIKKFYDAGARTYQGESTMGWVSRGPGHYIVSKLLWNRDTDIEAVKTDFFNKAYGSVSGLIRKLYDEWEHYPHLIASDSDLATWMGWVNEAYNNAGSDLLRKRIDQLKIYIHYLVLYKNVKANPTENNLLEVMRYAYRNFENPAFSTLPTLVSLPNYTGFPPMGIYANPEQKYKNDDRPYSKAEMDAVFNQDMRQIKRSADLTVFKKADGFVKLETISSLKNFSYTPTSHAYWGPTEYVIRINKKDTGSWFNITSNLVKSTDLRQVEINVYPYSAKAVNPASAKPLLQYKQTKAGVNEKFSLKSLAPGYYIFRVDDARKMFTLSFSPSIDYSIVMNAHEKLLTTTAAAINSFLFYVPKGVKNFRVVKTVIVKLKSPTGRIVDYANNAEQVFEVDVKPGEEGIWTVFSQSGNLYIDGIPPYLGDIPSRMLVPSYLKK